VRIQPRFVPAYFSGGEIQNLIINGQRPNSKRFCTMDFGFEAKT
jgi:hypothetical protein